MKPWTAVIRMLGVVLIGSVLAMPAAAIPFEGKAVGSWDNAIKESTYATVVFANQDSGGGVAKVTWGTRYGCFDSPSYMTFDGAGSDPNMSPALWNSGTDPFLLGNLAFYNGVIDANSGIKGVNLNVNVTILTPNLGPLSTFTYGLGINNTINPQGDTVWEVHSPDTQIFQWEGQSYLFDILGFRQQDCHGNWSFVNSLFAREDRCVSAQLMGRVVAQGHGTPVPEVGSTIVLLGLAIAGMAALRAKIG